MHGAEATFVAVLVPDDCPTLVRRAQETEEALSVVARALAQDIFGRAPRVPPVNQNLARRPPELFEADLLQSHQPDRRYSDGERLVRPALSRDCARDLAHDSGERARRVRLFRFRP